MEEEDDRVDPNEMDEKFALLLKVEARKFIYDSRDPNHSKREILLTAWIEIASDIKKNGDEVSVDWCKKEWKKLKDYYYRIKKQKRGKSGDSAKKSKPWIYFSTLDRMLSTCVEENFDTQSNMEEGDSDMSSVYPESQSPASNAMSSEDGLQATTSSSTESTPILRNKKRQRAEDKEKLIEERILKLLDEQEEPQDECHHFSMMAAAKLRRLPSTARDYAMKCITDLLYDLQQQNQTFV